MAAATLTVYPEAASVHEGRLAIGGCDVLELAREFGTPAYIVAEDDLRARARDFLRAMAAHHGERGAVAFASKAFPCTEVLRIFREEGLAVDVASAASCTSPQGRLRAERIIFHGNAKSDAELRGDRRARRHGVIDNLDEIDRLGRARGRQRQPVMLRVVPEVETDTHHAVATATPTRSSASRWPRRRAAIERLPARGWADVQGIHMHIGSQLFDLAPYREAIEAMAALGAFERLRPRRRARRAYTAEHRTPSIDEWVAGVVDAAHELLDARARARDRARPRARRQRRRDALHRRVGQAPASRPGSRSTAACPTTCARCSTARPTTADVADRLGSEAEPGERCHLAGKHCESGDVIAWGVRLRDPRPGDVVVTPATGAYGHALANNYNGVPRPPVILCAGGESAMAATFASLMSLRATNC